MTGCISIEPQKKDTQKGIKTTHISKNERQEYQNYPRSITQRRDVYGQSHVICNKELQKGI